MSTKNHRLKIIRTTIQETKENKTTSIGYYAKLLFCTYRRKPQMEMVTKKWQEEAIHLPQYKNLAKNQAYQLAVVLYFDKISKLHFQVLQ